MQHWAVIAYTGQDEGGGRHGSGNRPEYRVAYVEKPDLPDAPEDYLERARHRLPLWIKSGKPFDLLRAEPYVNSQRVAREAFKGRIFLAGDALHSNNPIGKSICHLTAPNLAAQSGLTLNLHFRWAWPNEWDSRCVLFWECSGPSHLWKGTQRAIDKMRECQKADLDRRNKPSVTGERQPVVCR